MQNNEERKEIKPKVSLNVVNKNEGGCACQTLGIECTCGEKEVALYEELELPPGYAEDSGF